MPEGGDELVDVGDEWSVGFGLPLANTDIEGILVVDEQVQVPRRASTLWVGPGQGVCEGLPESVDLGDVVRGFPQREGSGVDKGALAVAGKARARGPGVAERGTVCVVNDGRVFDKLQGLNELGTFGNPVPSVALGLGAVLEELQEAVDDGRGTFSPPNLEVRRGGDGGTGFAGLPDGAGEAQGVEKRVGSEFRAEEEAGGLSPSDEVTSAW